MWQRLRQYLPPFNLLNNNGQPKNDEKDEKNKRRIKEDEEEEDDYERKCGGGEETSFDATLGLLSDDDESGGNFSSTRSSFKRLSSPKIYQRTASTASGQQPPRGKFFKRSETAPRSSTSGGGGGSFGGGGASVGVSKAAEKQRKKQQQKRPFSATPEAGGGDAQNSTTENLTSRLSRRSSIISDLVALMVRRSSSMGHRGSGQQRKGERGGGGGGSSSGGGTNQNEEISSQDHQKERSVDSQENKRNIKRHDYNNGGGGGGEDEEEEDIGNMPREKILQRIRHHKEIIGKVRLQPWPMRRKRRALKVARQYLQRQEAQVSKWNLYKVEASRRSNQAWRWAKNLSIYLIPWESKIKQIESNFGSVVSSFFIFLRWVLGMNVANSLLVMAFVVVPEWLADTKNDIGRFNRTKHIKTMPTKVAVHSDELNTVLDFGGYLQYSYLFYGYYSHETVLKGFLIGYHVPVAYVFLNLFLLVFCIFIILKKMTSNTRKSKLSSGKQEQYVFTWKAINGWDYNIGEPETAASLAMANAIKLKEASTEYKKKFKQKLTFQKVFVRVVVNLIITSMMFLSMLAIYKVAQITEKDTFIKQNAVSITVGAITLLFPPVFELILKLELYRPRTALRVHLFRVLFFYLLNYFTLVYSLFIMLNTLEGEMRANEMWKNIEKQNMESPINSLAASQYQFHIARNTPTEDGDWNNNQSFYEVVSSPLITSSNEIGSHNSQQQIRPPPPFLFFASVSATQSGEQQQRRDKRFFPLFKSRIRTSSNNHPKRKKKKPSTTKSNINNNNGGGSSPKERDLSVLYGSNPFPGHELASTTTTPPTTTTSGLQWTTVQPHFGPLFVGVSNPKAIVLPGDRVHHQTSDLLGTFWESRKIGPGSWPPTQSPPHQLNYTSSPKIRQQQQPITQPYRASNYDDLCWETLIGQEVAKIVTTDLVMTVAAIIVIDFFRGLWIRYCSNWWCWDIEATFPEYGEFKVAENVLHLVNSQAMVCLGTILVPMLPLINCIKLVAVMYIRAWACMVCNVPAKQVFRASRSSNFYFWLLLAFVCMSTLPVGFVIAYKRPSKNCGPFAGQERFYSIIGKVLQQNLPKSLVEVISYFMSPGIIFPVFLILVLVIYFLVLLVSGLRAANSDLNKQLTLERTEEKRRIFELANKGKQHLIDISHKHRPSGESRGSGNNNNNRNGKKNGKKNGNKKEENYDDLGFGNNKKEERKKLIKEEEKEQNDGRLPSFLTNGTTKTKKGLRKSWHGGGVNDDIIGTDNNKDFLTPFLKQQQQKNRSPTIRQYSDDSSGGGSSPSKSPLRHAGFLPSLASVGEDEEEENDEEEEDDYDEDEEEEMIIHGHAEAMIFRRKRSSNSSCQPKLSSRRSSALQQQQRRKSSSNKSCLKDEKRKRLLSSSSLQLTWKDKFLICIGWTDPAKLEIKLRAQMAENLIEKGGEKEEVKDEGKEKEKLNRRTTNKEEKQTIKQPFVVLEEAEYSVPSGGEEEDVDDILERKIEAKIPEENKIDIRRKYLNGIPIGEGDNNNFIFGFDDTPILPSSAMSQVSSSSTSRISQQLASSPNVIVNKLADLYEENLSPSNRPSSSSSSSSIGTGSQRSWIRQQQQPPPQLPRYSDHHQTIDEEEEKLENGKILFLNGKEKTVNKEKSISIEREHVSESSPLSPSNRQLALFPSEEMARLSNNKRYPLTREDIQTRGSLPPLVPKRKQTNGKEAFYHHLKQQQLPTNLNLFPQDLPSHSDEYLTLLLEEPSTPIGNFRPIKASEMLGEESFDNNSYNKTPETASSITTNTTSTSERSDPRLQYANPYSSYAAAMSSPIEIPEETLIKNKKSFQQYSPQMFQNNNRSITTTPQTSLLPFLQRCRQPTPPAIFSSKFEQEHLKQKEMSKIFHFTPPPKYSSSSFSSSGNDSSSLDASTSIIATKNYSSSKIPQYLINKQLKNNIISPIKNNNNNLYDDDDKNLTAIQRRRKQFAEQMPIYKQQQIIDQQYRSPYLLAIGGGDEGGSTSGRGTMPPGYGSSPPTSGSSPEFGHHSKYKISSLSPGRHREQELENYGDSSTTSPEGSPKRKFEIRQRSGLGLGRPLRIPSNNNNEINNKKKRDDKTPTNNNIVTKQSIV